MVIGVACHAEGRLEAAQAPHKLRGPGMVGRFGSVVAAKQKEVGTLALKCCRKVVGGHVQAADVQV